MRLPQKAVRKNTVYKYSILDLSTAVKSPWTRLAGTHGGPTPLHKQLAIRGYKSAHKKKDPVGSLLRNGLRQSWIFNDCVYEPAKWVQATNRITSG